MAFKAKQCRGVNARTGEPCRQPSLKGKEYCRFHIQAGEAGREPDTKMQKELDSDCVDDDTCVSASDDRDALGCTPSPNEDLHAHSSGRKPKRGARRGNRNARRHGLFSTRMPPEEQELYEENKRLFAEQLGELNTFDELVVHLLALVSTKLDVAAVGGAAPQSIIPLSNEVLRLLRSLKETRDSRDEEDAGAPKTFADFLAEAEALAEAEGIVALEDDARERVAELEREVDDLRRRLKLPPREGVGHRKTHCARCGGETAQHLNLAGEWICMSCGVDAGLSGSRPSSANKTSNTETSLKASKAHSAAKDDKPKKAEPKHSEPEPPPPTSIWAAVPPPPRNE